MCELELLAHVRSELNTHAEHSTLCHCSIPQVWPIEVPSALSTDILGPLGRELKTISKVRRGVTCSAGLVSIVTCCRCYTLWNFVARMCTINEVGIVSDAIPMSASGNYCATACFSAL